MKSYKSNDGYIQILKLDGGITSHELLTEMGLFAIEKGLANDGFIEAIIDREENYPTGIESSIGIAIPHTDSLYTNKESIIVAHLEKAVDFQPMGIPTGNVKVEVVFMLLMKDSAKHIDLLSKISELIQDENKVKLLKTDEITKVISDDFDQFFN